MKDKFLNITPDLTVVFSIALALVLTWLVPIVKIISAPFNLIGWAVVAIGVIFAINTISIIRLKNRMSYVMHAPSKIIAEGAYSVSRNPFYLSYIVIAVGVALILGSLSGFIAPLFCFSVLNFFVVPAEEKNLQKSFGHQYEHYKRIVPRWI